MLRKNSTAIVLTLFAVWFLGFAYQVGRSTQQQENRKKIETAYKADKSIQNQTSAHDAHARPNQPTQPQTREGGHETPEISFLFLKLGEALLALVTVWLVLVTRDLVNDARESSTKIWTTAEKQRATSEDTAQRQLRAYVCLGGGSITLRKIDEEIYIEGFVSLNNFGQTPAYAESSWVRIDLRNATDLPFDLSGPGLTEAIRAPGREFDLPVHHGPICPQDLADIRSETKRIFVWGGSDYIDAFGTRRFYKFFCWNAKELPSGKGWPLIPADKPDEGN